jgi:nucleoside-diphosphate-sugar epimerase
MRVLVTGMGGELGTRVAQLLEERTEVHRDRRCRLRAAAPAAAAREFRRIDPRDREKLARSSTDFAPTASRTSASTSRASRRMAPEAGSHVPSPLGRFLRLPVVPVPALADPAFQLLHQEDAARAMVAALLLGVDGPFNVVGPGAASVWQAVRLGGRIPWPVFGLGWRVATRTVELAGAPVPPHILELITKGRTADGSRAMEVLELGSMRPTQEVCTELFEWAKVTPLRPALPIAEAQ